MLLWLSSAAGATNDRPIKEAVRIGSDVTVEEGQVVTKAVAIGGSVTVHRDARVASDAVAIGGDVILKANARVDGNAVAIGGDILKEEGASVGGNEVTIFSPARGIMEAFKAWGLRGILLRGYLAITALYLLGVVILTVLGILLLLFVPGAIQTIAATIRQQALKSGAWGVGSLIAIVLLLILTAGSLLGMLLVPALMVAVAVCGLLGCIGTGLFIGERAASASGGSPLGRFLLGMLILGAIGLVPLVGGLAFLVANLFGFGAAVVSRVGRVQPEATD
ncbi:MAG: hypothetical protein HYZ81_19140 [Nitrospinae bacterium]|nr:hypothetical protein [Nitrospinota bacterium]